MKSCAECGHSKNYHTKDGCKFMLTEEDICECFCFEEVREAFDFEVT